MGSQTLVFHQHVENRGSENRTSVSRGNGFLQLWNGPVPASGGWGPSIHAPLDLLGTEQGVLGGWAQQFSSWGSADSSGLVEAPSLGLLEGQNFAECGAGTIQTPEVWKFLSLLDVLTPFSVPNCFSHQLVGQQSNERSFSLAGGRKGEEVGRSGVLSQGPRQRDCTPLFSTHLSPARCLSSYVPHPCRKGKACLLLFIPEQEDMTGTRGRGGSGVTLLHASPQERAHLAVALSPCPIVPY